LVLSEVDRRDAVRITSPCFRSTDRGKVVFHVF
jgi:hypothetical protein